MRGTTIKQYSSPKFHGKSLNSLFFKNLERKKKENQFLSFNSQIIMGSSSLQMDLISRQKNGYSLKVKDKQFLFNSSHSKDQLTPKTEFPFFGNPKTSQRQKVNYKENKPFQHNIIKNKTELFTKKQSRRYFFSKQIKVEIPSSIFGKIKRSQSIFTKSKNLFSNNSAKQNTLQKVQPWVTNQDTMNETLHLKTEGSVGQNQLRKPHRLKKLSYKFT